MKNDYTKEEIISLLTFVENKVHQYLAVVDDTNLDSWCLDINNKGEDAIAITTSTYCCGSTDYKSYSVTFEKLLATTEEQVCIIEAERKAEEERKKQLVIEKELQRKKERQQRDYEEYLRLKSKYEK